MKNAILIISLFAALNAFADICPDWDENTVYNAGDDVCYNNQPYEVAPNVYNISGYTYRPDGPFAHFWQGTDDCDCEVPPQQDLWEPDGDDIKNTNSGKVYIGDKNSEKYIEFSVNSTEGGKIVSRSQFGGRADFSTMGFSIGSNTVDYVRFDIEGLHVSDIQSLSAATDIISFKSNVVLDSDCRLTAGEVWVEGDASIDGELLAKKVTVALDVFPDYVFSKSHSLKSLSEIEKYIEKNGTLPGMPSEKEVKKNGVDLGEMQSKLLEKIEEMTLHMIALEKKNNALEAKVNILEKEVESK